MWGPNIRDSKLNYIANQKEWCGKQTPMGKTTQADNSDTGVYGG